MKLAPNLGPKLGLAVLGALSGAVLALPAEAGPATDTPCFLTRDMRNHTIADDHTLYVDVGGRAVYRVSMSNKCLAGSTSSDPIVLRDTVGSGRICHRLDFDVSVHGSHCIVDSIARLTPAEVAALPRKLKP